MLKVMVMVKVIVMETQKHRIVSKGVFLSKSKKVRLDILSFLEYNVTSEEKSWVFVGKGGVEWNRVEWKFRDHVQGRSQDKVEQGEGMARQRQQIRSDQIRMFGGK